MRMKKTTLMICTFAVAVSSIAEAGLGSELKRGLRKVDPSRVLKKTVEEFERVDDNLKKYIKNPSDAVRSYVDLINPVKAVEEVSRGIGKVSGGELGRFADKVKTESSRINKDIDTAIEGASDALRLALTHPKEGLPRLGACLYTACTSEIVLHKRVEKLKKEKRQEYLQKVEEMERQNSQELRNLVAQRIVDLDKEMDQLEEQIALTERVLQLATLINTRISRAAVSDVENASVVAALSTPETQRIVSELIAQMAEIYSNVESVSDAQIAEYRKLEDQLTMIALSANTTFNVVLAATVDGMSNGQSGIDNNFRNAIRLQGAVTVVLGQLYKEGSRLEFELEEEKARLEAL